MTDKGAACALKPCCPESGVCYTRKQLGGEAKEQTKGLGSQLLLPSYNWTWSGISTCQWNAFKRELSWRPEAKENAASITINIPSVHSISCEHLVPAADWGSIFCQATEGGGQSELHLALCAISMLLQQQTEESQWLFPCVCAMVPLGMNRLSVTGLSAEPLTNFNTDIIFRLYKVWKQEEQSRSPGMLLSDPQKVIFWVRIRLVHWPQK